MRISINLQIILIAMLPVVLIDAVFTYVHINSSIEQAEKLLQSKGEIIAKQISDASEFYLYSGNYEQISHLLNQSIDAEDVIYAAVYNRTNEIIAHASAPNFNFNEIDQYLYYLNTVYTNNISQEDIFEPHIESNVRKSVGWVHLYLSKSAFREHQHNVFIEGSIIFIVMLLISILLTSLISKRITKPIKRLITHFHLVETGQLNALITDIESNEIGEMQRGFNSMSQSLMTNRQHLDQKVELATHKLISAISTLEHRNSELSIARDSAQKADQVKSQFLANMSHEIRTPINGIKGYANLLLNSGLNADQIRYANIISQSTLDLNNIINEVLDYSKMEFGKLEIVEAPFNLHELVESTRDSLFAVNLGNDEVDINLIIYSDTPLRVIGDKNHLRQILVNLISNAIKFTDKGYVSITVLVEDEIDEDLIIHFKIKDSGIGISQKDQKQLFKAFSQIEADSNRRFSGSGLGLVISRNLAKLMGGDISLNSEQGKGSTFTLSLPFKPFSIKSTRLEKTLKNPFYGQSVLIFASKLRCLNELSTLYDRAGFVSEAKLIDDENNIQSIEDLKSLLSQSSRYIDLIVYDLRHSNLHPSLIISTEIAQQIPVIIMHYDPSMIDMSLYSDYRFISVINPCNRITQLLQEKPESENTSLNNGAELLTSHPKKILIVDDNTVNLSLAMELTKFWGHNPEAAQNSHQALDLFKANQYDLILLDIQMPEIDGIETMQMMRQHSPELDTPIVALTATHIATDKDRLMMQGFDAFLSKPLDEDILRKLLNQEKISIKSTEVSIFSEDSKLTLDYEKTLQLSANNAGLVTDIFQLLKDELPLYRSNLKTAIKAQMLDDIASIIHKLHGITCYTALPLLKSHIAEYQSIKYAEPEKIYNLSERIISVLSDVDIALEPYLEEEV